MLPYLQKSLNLILEMVSLENPTLKFLFLQSPLIELFMNLFKTEFEPNNTIFDYVSHN